MANDLIKHVSDSSFEADVLQSDKPVLVDFWAEWCGPCRMIGPMLDQLAVELAGQAKVVKINVDENPNLAARFEVRSIPMLLMFKGGQVRDMVLGAGTSKDALEAKLRALA